MPERSKPERPFGARPGIQDRLDSWKEIADYLGREQRTVQRWERTEGLPVRRLQHGKAGSVYALKAELDAWLEQRSKRGSAPSPVRRRRGSRRFWTNTLLLAALIVLVGASLLSRRPSPPSTAVPVPLTTNPGTEWEARLSPNAMQVAYAWNGEAEDNFDIYVRMLAGGPPLRLTTDPAPDYSPAWSPDGSAIAFLRRTGPVRVALFLVPALGGSPRKIAEFGGAEWNQWSRPGPFLTWSPDGKWLVTAGWREQAAGDVLLRVSPASGEILPLTSAPPGTMGDMAPAFSPDGKKIAFSRLLSWGRSELCLLPVEDGLRLAGEVRVLNTGSTWNASPVWSLDGHNVLFSTGSMDASYLARIEVGKFAQAHRLLGVGDYGWMPSLARSPEGRTRLVYTQHFESVNIWRIAIDGGGAPARLVASAHWSYEPAWSPDGKRIAFLSDRTGYGEIWVAGADGRNPQQWTFLKQPRLGGPRWSPDGRRIACTAPGARGSSIYVIDAPGTPPRLISGSEQSGYLEWSHDGRAVYFSSNRSSQADIWKAPLEGGPAVRITDGGARVPGVSSDGRFLYYLRLASPDGRNDLWRKPLGGGVEEKVLDFVDAYSLGDTGIAFKYYRPGPQAVGPSLQFFRFATAKTEHIPTPPRPLRYGIALSRDGRNLLYAQADYQISDLMLVENFR